MRKRNGKTYEKLEPTEKDEHQDVEYHVKKPGEETLLITLSVASAMAHAAFAACAGTDMLVDVVIWSEDGAEFFGGDEGLERYLEDPEASVFERIRIQAESLGRVP